MARAIIIDLIPPPHVNESKSLLQNRFVGTPRFFFQGRTKISPVATNRGGLL